MQDKTINNALQQLYREAMNGQHEGKEHILALLAIRGVEPRYKRPTQDKVLGRNGTKRFVQEARAGGPKSIAEMGRMLQQRCPHLTRRQAYHRVYMAMWRMGGLAP